MAFPSEAVLDRNPRLAPFFERLIVQAATIDELLSDNFEAVPGQKDDCDLAARRLAAWCRSSASGDWALFARRLERDGLSLAEVLTKFGTIRRRHGVSVPAWVDDAIWIDAALQSERRDVGATSASGEAAPCPFEHLFTPVVEQAEALLWAGIGTSACENLTEVARTSLRHLLLTQLCGLSAPALYERFAHARRDNPTPTDMGRAQQDAETRGYDRFITEMKSEGFRRLFQEKPVLLRLTASITRQWIDTSREFILRLDSDLVAIRRNILNSDGGSRIARIDGDLSDPHNGGHSVLIVRFEDNSRVVYKPKDLRLDAAWHSLIERLNRSNVPIDLRAVRVIARDGYGWTGFVDHTGCADEKGCERFFRRAGAWLALFHCFAGSDMHQENMIAAGEHPVPIDLEMILQASAVEHKAEEIEAQAFQTATELLGNSVMTVGLLPAYGRSPDNRVFAIGGMISDWTSRTQLAWSDINSDTMRPAKTRQAGEAIPNLPHVNGRYAKLGDHIEGFIAGFEDYASFLMSLSRGPSQGRLFEGFAGFDVRKLIRPTRFYYMLLQRLRNHLGMDDGVTWSAQADFLTRLTDWERTSDPLWPLQRAERAALLTLNVPHFVSWSDGNSIRDANGTSVLTEAQPGLNRARARVANLDPHEIAWQVEVIRQNTASVPRSEDPAVVPQRGQRVLRTTASIVPDRRSFLAEADGIAAEIEHHAIRKGPAAAWIGLAWVGDADAQLTPLGADLYNGVTGVAFFFAAHAAVTASKSSRDMALAAVAHVRKDLKGRNAARVARSLGTGGGAGLGSIVYAFAVMAKCLRDDDLLADAHMAAKLFSDDLIKADRRLDVIGGSAGGILGLLRLHRDSPSADVLASAEKCGEHLLAQPRRGKNSGSWLGQGSGDKPLNGMSHGAAGFAYALASLAATTGRDDFATAALQCIAFENASYDSHRNNWADFRSDDGSLWSCKWCHGAPGIGIARIASAKRGRLKPDLLTADVRNALAGVERGWPGQVDTLCCGTLGSIEFFCEAADVLDRPDLRERASQRLAAVMQDAAANGDYRWNIASRQFNLGLFRGLAGVGYTLLRRVDRSLPNVLIWE